MWRPQSWQDVLALIGHAEESAALDFKAQVTGNNRELAKDIAAMTVNGGVLVYGVEEDATTGVAARIAPIPLSGVEERIRQVAGSAIRPAPTIEVDYIREADGDADGVVVVAIPPSRFVPHMVDGRYPRRDGTTTGRMDEPEVERAYHRRSEGLVVPTSSTELFTAVEWLPGLPDERARSVYNGFGQVRVAAQPAIADAAHPATPWLGDSLREALDRTRSRAHRRLTSGSQPPLLAALHPWRAAGTDAWVAGDASGDEGSLGSRDTAAAVLRYPAQIVVQTTFPIAVAGREGGPPYLCAYEWRVAVEVWTMLTFIGEFLTEVDGGSLAACGIELAGFAGAVSFDASRARPGLPVDHLPTAPAGVVDSAVASALELREAPETLTQRFLDRWLVSFYEGAPLMQTMLNPKP